MNQIGVTILTVVLSAFIGSITTLFIEKSKLKYGLQVENEYKILMRIWEKAYWLKSRACNLRPEDGPPATKEKSHERLQLFDTAESEYEQEMYLNKPFYPQQIHELLKELKVAAHMEAFAYVQTSPNQGDHNYRREYWDEAKQNAKNINEIIDKLCTAIQRRVHESPSDAF